MEELGLLDECLRYLGREVIEFPTSKLTFGMLNFAESELFAVKSRYLLPVNSETKVLGYFKKVGIVNSYLREAVKANQEVILYMNKINKTSHKINDVSEMINIRLSLINKELDRVSMWNPWKFKRLNRESNLLVAWQNFLFDLQKTLGI